ncbi:MAG TPA: hypothetical protein VL147_18715 [Devosia sp.]|nr:hypothetical protein [Devosia sp.]
MKHQILAAIALGLASLAVPAFAADFDYTSLAGSWQVDAVTVPDEGVQALVDNDPQYMGAVIAFGASDITWTKGTKTRPVDPSIDNCATAPSLTPWVADPDDPDQQAIEGGYSVMCGDESWGTVVPVDDKTVKLYWYDNGVLTLTRQ